MHCLPDKNPRGNRVEREQNSLQEATLGLSCVIFLFKIQEYLKTSSCPETALSRARGAKPVNILFVFLCPSLLFRWSIRLFIRSTFYFIDGQLKFYMVNFFLFISVSVTFRLQTADWGWNAESVLKQSTFYDRGINLIVKRKSEALNVLKLLIQSTIPKSRLPSQHKTKVRETGFYRPSNRNCPCAMKVYRYYF